MFLFDPVEWKGRDSDLKFNKSKLTEDRLRQYAAIATDIRYKFSVSVNDIEKARLVKGQEEDKETQ